MKQFQKTIEVRSGRPGLHEITSQVDEIVRESKIGSGICHVFVRHTSASLVIQENADPAVQGDLLDWLERLAPDGDPRYAHSAEGPDDMPAHIKSVLLGSGVLIPITRGRLKLGTWQGIYLCEFRNRGGSRRLVITITS